MSPRDRHLFFSGGYTAGGLLIAASAANWFITPLAHPDATSAEHLLAGAQVVGGLVLAVLMYRRARHVSATVSESAGAQG